MESIPAILWMPSRNRLAIDSPLPADAALSHLQAAFDDEFRGRIEQNGVKIWRARGFAVNRGSFAPLFYGTVNPTPTGSRLSGHFQMHPVTRLYTAAWIGLSTLLALVFLGIAALRATPASTAPDALPVLLVALLPLAGFLLIRWQQRKGQVDEAAVWEWMEKKLSDTQPIS